MNHNANNNLAHLTASHRAIASKKRASKNQIKEIIFDDDARREFLTGFHKRKLAKAETARAKAKEKEKQERLEARREQRRILRERAIENSTQVELAYGAIITADSDDEWQGLSETPNHSKGKEKEAEYEDEEVLATVTVVEDFDPDTIIHGPIAPASSSNPTRQPQSTANPPTNKPRSNPDSSSSSLPKKSKKHKIRYETKDARKMARTKERARRTEKAELAGGKGSRKRRESKSRKPPRTRK